MTGFDEGSESGNGGEGTLGGSWSQFDFEAALPLYVGEDLDPTDAARVEAWIQNHPEGRTLLDAARASRDVLADHARELRSRPVPDLWPSVRAELARTGAFTGAFTGDAPQQESEPERSIPALAPERRVAAGEGVGRAEPAGTPILGGAGRFRRRAVAMAAAVLLVTTVGLMIEREGAPLVQPTGTDVALEGPSTTFTGGAAEVRLVGAPVRRGARLRRAAGGAVHLIDDAPAGALWQVRPAWQSGARPALEVIPLKDAEAALAGGR